MEEQTGDILGFGQGEKLRLRPGGDDPSAEIDQGLFTALQPVQGHLEPFFLRRDGRPGPRRRTGLIFRLGRGDVLGQVDEHRAGPAAPCDAERFPYRIGQILHPLDDEIVFGDRHGDAGDVHFLEGVPAQQRHRHIARDGHHRDGIHIRRGNAGDQIGRAGAGGGEAHPHLSGGPGISVGRVGGALLVGGHHMPDPAAVFIKGVIDVEHRPAGIAEHGIDPLLEQTFHQYVRTVSFHRCDPSFPGIPLQKKALVSLNKETKADSSAVPLFLLPGKPLTAREPGLPASR